MNKFFPFLALLFSFLSFAYADDIRSTFETGEDEEGNVFFTFSLGINCNFWVGDRDDNWEDVDSWLTRVPGNLSDVDGFPNENLPTFIGLREFPGLAFIPFDDPFLLEPVTRRGQSRMALH